jgi:hypothetical protein
VKDINTDRDASLDRLLPGALSARAGEAADGACLDAETLAAWADEALDPRERASAEAHAADCARCQALLAAMIRTAPPMAEARSWWRLPALGWLVPLTVAATALVIWVAVPNRVPVQVSDGGAEVVDQVTPAGAPAPATAPRADAQAPGPPAIQPRTQAARERDSAAFAPPVDRREQRKTEALEKDSPPAEAKANALSEAVRLVPAAPVAGAAPAPAPAFAPAAPPQSADSNLQRAAPAASARVSTFANATETLVVSSNPATRFRLLRGGGVQRSADAGATWRIEVTGATETLTAGASPSPSVCWLVGPSGTVLLSTDGRSWRRVRFPETVDLHAVTATDHENATVTTADGRVFVTADGGQTWARVPAL